MPAVDLGCPVCGLDGGRSYGAFHTECLHILLGTNPQEIHDYLTTDGIPNLVTLLKTAITHMETAAVEEGDALPLVANTMHAMLTAYEGVGRALTTLHQTQSVLIARRAMWS